MKIELSPVVHEFNNCFQGQVETIVEGIYHKNYLLTQFCRWTTIVDVVEDRLEINTKKGNYDTKELDMLGLEQVVVSCEDTTEMIRRIREELDMGMPVIAGIQITNCPWDPNYKKEFVMEHMVIINGYDNDCFICCDATYKIQDGILPMQEFEKGSSNEYRKIVEFDKSKNLTYKDLEKLLKKKAAELESGQDDHFQRLERIAIYLLENANKIDVRETHLDNVLFSDNYMIIRDCAKVREMLTYIMRRYGKEKANRLEKTFENCMNKWLKIRILYVKAVTSKKAEEALISIAKRLNEIKALEEDLVEFILEIDGKKKESYLPKEHLVRNEYNEIESIEIREVNLSSYYNNKAFGLFEDCEVAAFTELGEYMLRKKTGIRIPIYVEKEYEFSIPEGDDNVICKGQNILVKLDDVIEFLIIGTTEYCTGSERIILKSENGYEEEILLDFPEWYTEIMKNEMPVLQQPVIEKRSGKVKYTSFAGKLFLKRFKIQKKNITNIIFPAKGRIHIFYILAIINNGNFGTKVE